MTYQFLINRIGFTVTNKELVLCRMVDEQIFIEVGKRWVEMMMDPGKKTKKAIKIHHQKWRKIREMIL
jgi:hypothetical protein